MSIARHRHLRIIGAVVLIVTFIGATASHGEPVAEDGQILFVGGTFNTDLFVMPPSGGTPAALTDTSGRAESHPDWAPDGATVAYVAPRDDAPMAAERAVWYAPPGEEARGLSFGPFDTDPDWSPAGDRVIFASALARGEEGQSTALTVARLPDGLEQRPLLEPLTRDDAALAGPRWSPDGQRVLFVVEVDRASTAANPGGEIYIARADGTGAGRLLAHPGWDDVEPAWAPDGRWIAFSSGHILPGASRVRHGLWMIDLATGQVGEVLSHPRLDLRNPAWSPGGDRIAFEARELGADRGQIHVTSVRDATLGPPLADGGQPDWWALADPSLATATTAPPTPTAGPSPTDIAGASPTPPGVPGLPTVPPLAPFPTLPPVEATTGPQAPPFPFSTNTPTASATPRPTSSATPTATTTPRPSPMIYLPRALRDHPTDTP